MILRVVVVADQKVHSVMNNRILLWDLTISILTANPDYYRQLEGIEAGYVSETEHCDHTDGLESFSRFGEFKLDKKYGTSASSSIIEKWTKYKEKRIAENGVRERENFHILQPQVSDNLVVSLNSLS